MFRQAAYLLSLGVIVLIAAPVLAGDKEKFQGKWKAEKAVRNGEEAPAEELAKMSIVFKDNVAIPHEGENARDEAEFTLDEKKKPKTIDIRPKQGNEKLIEGIYELDGDTLKICFAKAGRPSKFESTAGSDVMFIVLKRVKK